MITLALLKVLMVILLGLTLLLPTYTPPKPADLGAFQMIAWLVPINELVTLSAAMCVFAVASVAYVAVNWVINKARGSG